MIYLRSSLYLLGLAVFTPLFFFLGCVCYPFSKTLGYRMIRAWTPCALWWLKFTCNLRYEVIGREHIPTEPAIIASKHQSAWETLSLQEIFPQQVWVLKRELLWIPFFGWGLALLNPIAINRSDGRKAAQQLRDQGRDRIEKGFWIVIFPEGTRVKAGEKGKYKLGAAKLSRDLNIPMVPVAHNAGEFWAKNSFLKHAGTITVVIGPPIFPKENESLETMTQTLETWIEHQQHLISGVGPCASEADKQRRAETQA